MWVFLTARLRQWVLLSVVLPVLGAVARAIGERIERRRGSTRLSRGLQKVGSLGRRSSTATSSRRGRRARRG